MKKILSLTGAVLVGMALSCSALWGPDASQVMVTNAYGYTNNVSTNLQAVLDNIKGNLDSNSSSVVINNIITNENHTAADGTTNEFDVLKATTFVFGGVTSSSPYDMKSAIGLSATSSVACRNDTNLTELVDWSTNSLNPFSNGIYIGSGTCFKIQRDGVYLFNYGCHQLTYSASGISRQYSYLYVNGVRARTLIYSGQDYQGGGWRQGIAALPLQSNDELTVWQEYTDTAFSTNHFRSVDIVRIDAQ